MPAKTKTEPSAYEQRILTRRKSMEEALQRLDAEIGDVRQQAQEAVLEMPGRRVLPGGVEDHLVRLQERRALLTDAIAKIDRQLEVLPERIAEDVAAKEALAHKLAARDAQQARVEAEFRAIRKSLLELRRLNSDAFEQLTRCMKTWAVAGRAAAEMPRFKAVRFAEDLRRERGFPFVDLHFVGDQSEPTLRALPSADVEPQDEWGSYAPESQFPGGNSK